MIHIIPKLIKISGPLSNGMINSMETGNLFGPLILISFGSTPRFVLLLSTSYFTSCCGIWCSIGNEYDTTVVAVSELGNGHQFTAIAPPPDEIESEVELDKIYPTTKFQVSISSGGGAMTVGNFTKPDPKKTPQKHTLKLEKVGLEKCKVVKAKVRKTLQSIPVDGTSSNEEDTNLVFKDNHSDHQEAQSQIYNLRHCWREYRERFITLLHYLLEFYY
eukprot:sb/3469922/